jgi:AraC-like DNA-binding protein
MREDRLAATRNEAIQRAGPLGGLSALLREFDVDPKRIATGLEIDVDAITPDTRLRFVDAVLLLERAAEATGCAHFGLLLGSRVDHRVLGAPGVLMMTGSTLREAVTDFVTFQHRNSRGGTVYLHRLGGDYVLGYGVYGPRSSGTTQTHGVMVAVAVNAIRAITANRGMPIEVHLSHRAPADRRPYQEILKVPVRFDQYQTGLVLPAAAMDLRNPAADPAARARVLAQIGPVIAATMPGVTARLRHVLRPRLVLGDANMPDVAAHLGLHPRTLRRHLAQQGLTFEEVKDEVRYATARELLEITDLPVGDVAAALSFASHSAFVHAFRRWSGTTPTAWRAACAAVPSQPSAEAAM